MTGDTLYDRAASDAAARVISAYSTSFALACRLLGPRVRAHVRNVYALVRVADEIVDGAAEAAGVAADGRRAVLDDLEAQVREARERGFSTNLVVHAFASTARSCGIGDDLVAPFFASMRTDLDTTSHDDASHDAYVYGSAEVVGLMCLQVFVSAGTGRVRTPAPALIDGARRLGAAFQDVNFLRDRGDDRERLGREYLPSDAVVVLDRIDDDLDAAARAIRILPPDCRRAVTAAHDLFAELSVRLRRTVAAGGDPAGRVRVPTPVKLLIAARAALGLPPRRVTR
ncbi:squalene/phytoene synthase family protein [Microbacterium sp. W1N]|uniref:phytoene/squalene synthase family protein n=1 Tax=Microbacterium festucae TaxID=2977531 RepID=UPI0021C157BE|nr:squalene/phytoene synthase family protein [Microbacterium festucae]MCT9820429.1 squalene/phytoene synthase family protein [Microbacterium festucae]